jgi:hypothetical protein
MNLKHVFDEPRAHWHFFSSNLSVCVLGTSDFNASNKDAASSKDGQTIKSSCETAQYTASEAQATVCFFRLCLFFVTHVVEHSRVRMLTLAV